MVKLLGTAENLIEIKGAACLLQYTYHYIHI
jgi:hypothetical protein